MKLFKKIVDEREELELLRLEHIGLWVLFWGLLIAIHVQIFLDDYSFRHIAGEFILLLITAIFIVAGCIKKGLWSYSAKPTVKTNLLYSLAGSLAFGIISTALQYKRLPVSENINIDVMARTFIINAGYIFVACFVLLTVCGAITNKRKARLEKDFDENDNG